MPVYEYRCTSCDHRFEELVSLSGARLVACPSCASPDTEKLLSVFQRSKVGGDMPAASAAPAPRRGGGCCGGGCGCGH